MLTTRLRSLVTRLRLPSPPSAISAPSPVNSSPEISIDALLRRPAVNLDTPELQRFLAGKTVLVTGAGGSIGSEISRQILRFCPGKLILLEQAENALFEIHQELSQRWIGSTLLPIVADICDSVRINQVFAAHHPQVIFHCAAHKHVPMMELNPGEAIKNNVFGTKTVADAAATHHAHSFVLISTDKAVNPTSVMGAAKRCAELYIQSLNHRHLQSTHYQPATRNPQPATNKHCRFTAVRFGNVLGSSGSVVPTFKKQIAAGGPVTVTHPDMKRYFMTIPEASQLVLQAGAIADGGEIFILDMGQPIKILTLAEDLIRLSGLKPHADIAIEFTGIRPGEKLYEELAGDSEQTLPTKHPKIRTWQLPAATPAQIDHMLSSLTAVTNSSPEHVVRALTQILPEYTPTGPSAPAPQLRLVA